MYPNFVLGETNQTPCFKKKFPFGKIPALETPEGPIYESNAICSYISSIGSAKERLLGSNAYENALIMQYMSLTENEFMPPTRSWVAPLLGYMPYSCELVAKARSDSLVLLATLNEILLDKTFLVTEQVTLADICMACVLYVPFKLMLDEEARRPFPNVTRWFLTCFAQPEFACDKSSTNGNEDEVLCKVAITTPQKPICQKTCNKPSTLCQKKADANVCSTSATTCHKPTTSANQEEEEETVEAKPAKNDLDLLPASSFSLDGWKRFYSNNDTIPTAMDYFKQNFDPKGYSMYRLTYKYPSDLTKVFMSANLIGGFFQRLDHLRKYAFGSMCVFGTDNNSEISGMFIMRGEEIPEIFKDVPDYDSYSIEKVDSSNPAILDEWQAYIAWEGDFKKPFADGKIFK